MMTSAAMHVSTIWTTSSVPTINYLLPSPLCSFMLHLWPPTHLPDNCLLSLGVQLMRQEVFFRNTPRTWPAQRRRSRLSPLHTVVLCRQSSASTVATLRAQPSSSFAASNWLSADCELRFISCEKRMVPHRSPEVHVLAQPNHLDLYACAFAYNFDQGGGAAEYR